MTDIFDNSEYASIFWIIIFVCFLICYKRTRRSVKDLIKITFQPKFSIIYILALAYNAFFIFLLYKAGYWEISLLKETLLWILLAGSVMMFNIIEVKNAKLYFIKILNDTFKWAVAIEFIVGLYSFNIYFEFFSIPISVFVGCIIAIGEKDERNISFIGKLKNIIFFTGSILIIYKLFQIISNYKSHLNIENLKQFMLTPILAALFIPFLYGLFLFVNYENIFVSINYGIKSPELRNYAKFWAFWKFNFNVSGLKRWRDSIFMNEIRLKNDVIESINKIKNLQIIEKNPPNIDVDQGWSPYVAISYLNDEGLITGYYFNYFENDWYANSNYLKLDDHILSNNIAYYISGDENKVNSLKLVLNVNNQEFKKIALFKFFSCMRVLHQRSLEKTLPTFFEEAVLNGNDFYSKLNFIEIILKKENWDNGNGYHVTFEIKHN